MNKNILEIKGLCKNYKEIQAVRDLTLEVKEGSIYGFIGPNGAGKSTTIKCILNMINYHKGEILYKGEPLVKDDIRIKKEIGYLPAEVKLYDDLTVLEIIKYNKSFYEEDSMDKALKLAERLNLDTTRLIEDLSLGNLKKVGIVLALMHNPKLIILDEPTSGLDPLIQNVFFDILKEEVRNGATILFSTHILSEVKKVCDYVSIIKNGTIVMKEDVHKLNSDTMVNISITSDSVNNIYLDIKEMVTVKNKDEEFLKVIFQGDINNLLKILSKYEIKRLLIEELDIEDIFMHYYV